MPLIFKRKIFPVCIILLLLLSTLACGSGGVLSLKEIPVETSFFVLTGDLLTFSLSFEEDVDGFTMHCDDLGTGYSATIIDNASVSAPYYMVVNYYAGWAWQPNQVITLSADGYESETIIIPEYGTSDWEQFINDAWASSGGALNIEPSNDSTGIDLNFCQKAQEEYENCMVHYAEADSAVDQTLWLSICQGWQDQINRNCQ